MTLASSSHLMILADWVPAAFVFAVGACVGSLVNVLVYRLPRGLPVVLPSSRCPNCRTKLTWRENIPILGWLALGGRCRFCRSRISAEYPLVELAVALLFLLVYVIWYIPDLSGAGVSLRALQPDWARNGIGRTWPAFAALLILLGCLVAMTIIDYKTFTIPLVLTWVPVGVALLLHPLNALLAGTSGLRYGSENLGGWIIAIPEAGSWWWLGACVGTVVGLAVANALLLTGLIGRSFADYHEWEARALAELAASGASQPDADTPDMWVQYPHARREMVRELAFLAAPVGLAWAGGAACAAIAASQGWNDMPLWLRAILGVAMGYLIGGALVWGVRIFGSLLFGKEAMGLGDVHVLAAIGACLGWPDAVLSFFAAVLVGLVSAVQAGLSSSKSARMLAFGPCLAVGAIVVLLGKPGLEWALGALFSRPLPIDLP
ncbi:MAG: prepilin peptidase [Phycisphaerales bacterium]